MAFVHTVTDKNGKQHKRRSQNHRYTFAVIAHYPAQRPIWDPKQEWPPHSSASWSTKLHFAEQYAADRIRNGAAEIEIIEATIEETGSKQT